MFVQKSKPFKNKMDIIAWFFILVIVGTILLVVVDKAILWLKEFKEVGRSRSEHIGVVVGKRFIPESSRLYGARDFSGMGPAYLYEEYQVFPSRYEVEVVINGDSKEIFDDKSFFEKVKIGDHLLITMDHVSLRKESLMDKDFTSKLEIISWKKKD